MIPATGLKRLFALIYDGFLLLGVLFVSGIPLVFIPEDLKAHWLGTILVRGYLLGVIFLFFGWFWTHGGQTLGMRAWRLLLVDEHGKNPGWGLALKRFAAATVSLLPAGLGFVWIFIHSNRQAWHDTLSGTRVVQLPT